MKIKETLVQCMHCAHQFRSGIGFGDTESFERSDVSGNEERCPKCGQATSVGKANMAYRLEDGSIGGAGMAFKMPPHR